MRTTWIFISLVFFIVSGCSPDGGGKSPNKKQKFDPANYSTYRPTDVLIQVGTNTLTKSDVDRLVDLRMKVLRFSLPAAKREGKVSRLAVQAPILANAVNTYRAQVALLQWAATNGVTAGESEIRACEHSFMQNCKVTGTNFKSFLKGFSKSEIQTIKERVQLEATIEKVRKVYLAEHSAEIKPLDASIFIARLTNYNHSALATNALVWAKATNLWNQAKSGADFGKLADENSEDDNDHPSGEWGVFRLNDLASDDGLDRVVASMQVGGVSAPIEADNGLNIFKLTSVTDAKGNPVAFAARNADSRYALSRIFLKLPEIYDVPNLEEAQDALRKKEEDALLFKFVQRLMSVDGYKLPHGEGVFETARKMMKMPMMFQQEGAEMESK